MDHFLNSLTRLTETPSSATFADWTEVVFAGLLVLIVLLWIAGAVTGRAWGKREVD